MSFSQKNRFKNKIQSKSIKLVVKKLRENSSLSAKELGCSNDELNFAQEVIAAEEFVKDFTKGGNKYLCNRLRPGFIGDKVVTDSGLSYIQSERGKPFGSVVAISNGKGTVSIGVSYTEDEGFEHSYPIIGLATALKNAIFARDHGIEPYNLLNIKEKAKSQVEYFTKRALAYFNPDVYSYSRGENDKKVSYDNYDEIHTLRKALLKPEKLKSPKAKK